MCREECVSLTKKSFVFMNIKVAVQYTAVDLCGL